ncbi:MAG: hypothetical protein SWX82_12500 [Cyanobacteriota bacterium]|nr:hypothetical protein [Cyanobacteriota bacterium]
MNNETNKQMETFEDNFFNWLLGPNAKEVSNVGKNQSKIENEKTEFRVEELEWEELDPLDSEDFDYPYGLESQPLISGEVSTVYNRFETVLQRRLKTKIESKPPRFPWENNLVNYDAEYPEVEVNNWFFPMNLWVSQMKNIKWGRLNIPLTETVFAQLLQSCQEVSSDELPGKKLVRAVDSLFPNQSQSLNDLAGLVLVGGTRDGDLISNHITAYDSATEQQQMLLSLLAAKEIISSLSLICCLNESVTKREWQSALGWVTIEAEYFIPEDGSSACLRIKGQLPEAASFQLQGGEVQATAERSDAGTLCVELFDPRPDETYQLIIKFLNWGQSLKFVVRLQ